MSIKHRVKQGECLSSIAREAGLNSWNDIYSHQDNSELRKQRPNPNILFPGDLVIVPNAIEKSEQASTEQRHIFQRRQETSILSLRLLDEGWQPLAGKSYKLLVGLEVRDGVLDGDGRLKESIPLNVGQVSLELSLDDNDDVVAWRLDLKALDPLDTNLGVQERLKNLALNPGAIDGFLGPRTEAAIRRFQYSHGLEETGHIDRAFLKKLEEVYGS